MESMPSSSASTSTSHNHHHHPRRLIPPAQPVVDRIIRAIRHPLLLLHRSESNFFVLGATGNVYTVTLSATPTCTCPDRTTPCKHILFILIRVLGVSLDDSCLRRRTLRPCQLNRLLNTPIHPESLAGASLRERFHQLFFQSSPTRVPINNNNNNIVAEEGTTCPICLEEIIVREKVVVACGTCRNLVHEECLLRWKRSRGRRGTICVICRARWRHEENKYLNLAAYITTTPTGSSSSISDEEEINRDHQDGYGDGDDDANGNAAAAATTSYDNNADNDGLCSNNNNT